MIRAITLGIVASGLVLAAGLISANADTIIKATRGGTVTMLGDYATELVTTRDGDKVKFVVYVQDKNAVPITTGNLALSVIRTGGTVEEVVLTPDNGFYRGTATIIERGPIEIKEAYTIKGAAPLIGTLRLNAL